VAYGRDAGGCVNGAASSASSGSSSSAAAKGTAAFDGKLSGYGDNNVLKKKAESLALNNDGSVAVFTDRNGIPLHTCYHDTTGGNGLKNASNTPYQTIFYQRVNETEIKVIGLGSHGKDNQHYDIDWSDGKSTKGATFK
jgi:hypothetical protein